MQLHLENKAVDGLLFNYLHFWGSYDYVGKSSRWYPHEIRVIRNDANIYSYRDAQGFRKLNNEKLRVKEMAAWVYHYGWVREPATMKRKYEGVGKFWGGKEMPEDQEYNNGNQFDYSDVDMLAPFDGSHPKVMNETIQSKNWHFEYDPNLHKLPLKERFKNFVQKIVGRRIFDYKNYKIVQ
jgi:hypothetical protein